MNAAVTDLLVGLLKNIFIPEIIVAVRAHYNATGQMPTETQIFAAVDVTADRIVARGDAWVPAHPETL